MSAHRDDALSGASPLTCDCGAALTVCTSCAVGDYQASNTNCATCCPPARKLAWDAADVWAKMPPSHQARTSLENIYDTLNALVWFTQGVAVDCGVPPSSTPA